MATRIHGTIGSHCDEHYPIYFMTIPSFSMASNFYFPLVEMSTSTPFPKLLEAKFWPSNSADPIQVLLWWGNPDAHANYQLTCLRRLRVRIDSGDFSNLPSSYFPRVLSTLSAVVCLIDGKCSGIYSSENNSAHVTRVVLSHEHISFTRECYLPRLTDFKTK